MISSSQHSPYLFCVFCMTCIVITGCVSDHGRYTSQAHRHYKHGEFAKAVQSCVAALRSKSDYEKARELLARSFEAATTKHKSKISTLKASSQRFKWDGLVAEYLTLQRMKQQIATLPSSAKDNLNLQDYTKELADARTKAAATHYAAGQELNDSKNKADQRRAAIHFKKAMQYIPGYKNAQHQYAQAINAGQLVIGLLFPEPQLSNTLKTIPKTTIKQLQSNISITIQTSPNLSTYTRAIFLAESHLSINKQADMRALAAKHHLDQILIAQITSVTEKGPRTQKENFQQSANIITKEIKSINAEGKETTEKIKSKVNAIVTKHTLTAAVTTTTTLTIVEGETGEQLYEQHLPQTVEFEHSWGTWYGDERALSDEAKRLIQHERKATPSKADMAATAIENTIPELIDNLKAYYRKKLGLAPQTLDKNAEVY